jgi:hypothetical protein
VEIAKGRNMGFLDKAKDLLAQNVLKDNEKGDQ